MKVYELQGASIARKHIEIIIRQMFSRKRIKTPGGTMFSPGEIVENVEFMEENDIAKDAGGEKATGDTIVANNAASFQNTNRMLIGNAIKGGTDKLRGLKENVIIGRLIPAGTGFGMGGIDPEDIPSEPDMHRHGALENEAPELAEQVKE